MDNVNDSGTKTGHLRSDKPNQGGKPQSVSGRFSDDRDPGNNIPKGEAFGKNYGSTLPVEEKVTYQTSDEVRGVFGHILEGQPLEGGTAEQLLEAQLADPVSSHRAHVESMLEGVPTKVLTTLKEWNGLPTTNRHLRRRKAALARRVRKHIPASLSFAEVLAVI